MAIGNKQTKKQIQVVKGIQTNQKLTKRRFTVSMYRLAMMLGLKTPDEDVQRIVLWQVLVS